MGSPSIIIKSKIFRYLVCKPDRSFQMKFSAIITFYGKCTLKIVLEIFMVT